MEIVIGKRFTATGVGGAVGLIAHAHVEVKPDQDLDTATILLRNTKGITVMAVATKRSRVTFLRVQWMEIGRHGCDVAVPNRIRLNTESMQNEECLRMGYCFEKENILNPKCYMKKGPAGKRYESSIKMTSMLGKELGKSVSQIQCSLKCTLDENCVDVVFKPTNGNKGNCYVATGDHVPTADHTETGYIMKSAKP